MDNCPACFDEGGRREGEPGGCLVCRSAPVGQEDKPYPCDWCGEEMAADGSDEAPADAYSGWGVTVCNECYLMGAS